MDAFAAPPNKRAADAADRVGKRPQGAAH